MKLAQMNQMMTAMNNGTMPMDESGTMPV